MTDGIDDVWLGDHLGRRQESDFIRIFIRNSLLRNKEMNVKKGIIINIESPWGSGKTWFLKRLALDLEAEGHSIVFIDAWKCDHSDDPLLPIMIGIEKAIKKTFVLGTVAKDLMDKFKRSAGTVLISAAKGGIQQAAKRLIGEGLENVLEAIDSEEFESDGISEAAISRVNDIIDRNAKKLIDRFERDARSIDRFKKNLSIITSQMNDLSLYIIVDEMDRCRPTFAISLLERVKHIFDVDNVVFIIATDTTQLTHSISAVYGMNFNSGKYIQRFFDVTYTLADPNNKNFVKSELSKYDLSKIELIGLDGIDRYICDMSTALSLHARDIERIIFILSAICLSWGHKVKLQGGLLIPLTAAFVSNIDIKLNSETSAAIKNIARKGQSWNLQLTSPDSDPLRSVSSVISAFNALDEYIIASHQSIPDYLANKESGTLKKCIQNYLRIEFNIIHGNMSPSEFAPRSLMQRYPDLIRQAGFLKIL